MHKNEDNASRNRLSTVIRDIKRARDVATKSNYEEHPGSNLSALETENTELKKYIAELPADLPDFIPCMVG